MLTFEVLSDVGEHRVSDHELVDGVRVGGDVVQAIEVRRVRVEDVVAERCLCCSRQKILAACSVSSIID